MERNFVLLGRNQYSIPQIHSGTSVFLGKKQDCLTQNDSKTEKLQFYFALLCSLDDNSVCVGEMNTEDIAKTEFHETQVSFP